MALDLVVGLLAAGLALVVVVALARAVRRRLRLARAALLGSATDTLDAISSPGWWSAQRTRRGMWRSVGGAQRAVAAAERAGAPVGDLPLLCRQLRRTARLVDVQLRAAARDRGGVPDDVVHHVAQVRAAADHVTAAVTAAVTDTVQPQLADLVSAVRQECAALAAGTRAARRIG